MCSGLEKFLLYGVVRPTAMQTLKTAVLTNLDEFEYVCCSPPSCIELAEICGGEARSSRLASRTKMRHGPTFDLVLGVGIAEPSHQQRVLQYFGTVTVLVAVMAPFCTPYGTMSNLKWSIHPEAMQRRLSIARPIAKLCGNVVLFQLANGLDFIQEQAYPSSLYEEEPWPHIMQDDRVAQQPYDICMCGLKVGTGPYGGMATRKRSTMTASSSELIWPFRSLRCHGRHEHFLTEGHSAQLRNALVWTWDEARRALEGIRLAWEAHGEGHSVVPLYPVFDPMVPVARAQPGGEPQPGVDPRAASRSSITGQGCRHRRARNDWAHNRVIGQCCYPFDEPHESPARRP